VRRLVQRRARQVEHGLLDQLALRVAALAQLARELVGSQLVELAVVVEEAPQASCGPGPWMIRNQTPNTTSATIAVAPKMRGSMPLR
jgi:hypothetical protein